MTIIGKSARLIKNSANGLRNSLSQRLRRGRVEELQLPENREGKPWAVFFGVPKAERILLTSLFSRYFCFFVFASRRPSMEKAFLSASALGHNKDNLIGLWRPVMDDRDVLVAGRFAPTFLCEPHTFDNSVLVEKHGAGLASYRIVAADEASLPGVILADDLDAPFAENVTPSKKIRTTLSLIQEQIEIEKAGRDLPIDVVVDPKATETCFETERVFFHAHCFELQQLPAHMQLQGIPNNIELFDFVGYPATLHVPSRFDAHLLSLVGIPSTFPQESGEGRQSTDDCDPSELAQGVYSNVYSLDRITNMPVSADGFCDLLWQDVADNLDSDRFASFRLWVSQAKISTSVCKHIVVGFPHPIKRAVFQRLKDQPTHFVSDLNSLETLIEQRAITERDKIIIHEGLLFKGFDFDIDGYDAFLFESLDIFQVQHLPTSNVATFVIRRFVRNSRGKLVRGELALDVFGANSDLCEGRFDATSLLSGFDSNETNKKNNTLAVRRQLPTNGVPYVLVVDSQVVSPLLLNDRKRLSLEDSISCAHEDYPDANVLVYHPNGRTLRVLLKSKKFNFPIELVGAGFSVSDFFPLVEAVYTIANPVSLLAYAHGLHCVSLGDDALMNSSSGLISQDREKREKFLRTFVKYGILVVDPVSKDSTTLSALGSHLGMQTGAGTEVIKTCAAVCAKNATSPKLALHHFGLLINNSRIEEAVVVAKDLLSLNKGNESPEMFNNLLVALRRLGQWEEAFDVCIQMIKNKIFADNERFFASQLVQIRQTLDNRAECEKFKSLMRSFLPTLDDTTLTALLRELEKKRFYDLVLQIIRAKSGDLSPNLQLSALKAFAKLGDADRATQAFSDYCKTPKPDRIAALLAFADILRGADRWKQLRRQARKLLKIDPKFAAAYVFLGESEEKLGNMATAENAFWAAIAVDKSPEYRVSLGQFYIRKFKFFEAYAVIKPELLTSNPAPRILDIAGDYHFHVGDLQEAAKTYLWALSSAPFLHATYVKLRSAEAQLAKDGVEVLRLWSRQHRESLEKIRHKTTDQFIALGRVYLEDLEVDKQIALMKDALTKWPGNAAIMQWQAHGICWLAQEKKYPGWLQEVVNLQEVAIVRMSDDSWWAVTDYMRGLANIGASDLMYKVADQYPSLYSLRYGHFSKKSAIGAHQLACRQRNLGDIWSSQRDFSAARELDAFNTPFKTALHLDDLDPKAKIMFVSEAGIGDEIRFSTIYQKLLSRFENASVSADYRFANIIANSLPNATILPVRRVTPTELSANKTNYVDQLPASFLATYFDNDLWHQASQFDVVVPVRCTLDTLLPNKHAYSTLRPEPYQVPQGDVEFWSKRVGIFSKRPVIGLNWSSGVREYRRMPHYLNLSELATLVQSVDATFINLQYTDATTDISEIERTTGVKIINFEDLDMRDDLVGVSALMKNMDLVIGVNTAVVELSAAIGVPTLFCAMRPENDWRALTLKGKDAFFPAMKVLTADQTLNELPALQVVGKARKEIANLFPNAIEKEKTPTKLNAQGMSRQQDTKAPPKSRDAKVLSKQAVPERRKRAVQRKQDQP